MHKQHHSNSGFTLAELLIALMILGEIATFTIPKIITSQQNGRNNAIAKETMAMIGAAYQKAQMDDVNLTTSSMTALTQYMNYVAVDTSSTIDQKASSGASTFTCTSTLKCLRLHNGAMLEIDTVTGAYISAILDPDGAVSGNKDSLQIVVYPYGRVTYLGTAPSWLSF
jgi:prepilin-type N-terminal cleavage/methylation domain-containing protein